MLYNEFVEGTGCRDNDHNYQVYKDLEIMYMNSNMTKAQIYEYGKKLVDNSKSQKELELDEKIGQEIVNLKSEIGQYRDWIKHNQECLTYWKEEGDKEMIAFYKNPIKTWKKEIERIKAQIRAYEWVLE